MLKRKLNYFICFSILCYFICQSCRSDSILPSPSDENQNNAVFNFDSLNVEQLNQLIQGNWKWNYSRIFQRNLQSPNNIITPLTSGDTIEYKFEPNNKASYFKNKQFVQSYSYEIKRFKILPDDEDM